MHSVGPQELLAAARQALNKRWAGNGTRVLRRRLGPQGDRRGGNINSSPRRQPAGIRDGCTQCWMAKGYGAQLQAGSRQWGPEQHRKVHGGICGARKPSSRRRCPGQRNRVPLFPARVQGSEAAPLPARQGGQPRASPAARWLSHTVPRRCCHQ